MTSSHSPTLMEFQPLHMNVSILSSLKAQEVISSNMIRGSYQQHTLAHYSFGLKVVVYEYISVRLRMSVVKVTIESVNSFG